MLILRFRPLSILSRWLDLSPAKTTRPPSWQCGSLAVWRGRPGSRVECGPSVKSDKARQAGTSTGSMGIRVRPISPVYDPGDTMGFSPTICLLRHHEILWSLLFAFGASGFLVPRFAEWKRLSPKFLARSTPYSAWHARDSRVKGKDRRRAGRLQRARFKTPPSWVLFLFSLVFRRGSSATSDVDWVNRVHPCWAFPEMAEDRLSLKECEMHPAICPFSVLSIWPCGCIKKESSRQRGRGEDRGIWRKKKKENGIWSRPQLPRSEGTLLATGLFSSELNPLFSAKLMRPLLRSMD